MAFEKEMKWWLFGIAVFMAFDVRADLLVPHDPALHRIGYEIIACTVASVLGRALLRRLGKKNWRVNGTWKSIGRLNDEEVKSVEQRVDEVRSAFRAAVRGAYNRVDGLLGDGWQQDIVFAALEDDEDLMTKCKGIPLEILMGEVVDELEKELVSRHDNALPDFKHTFDEAYKVAIPDWLERDALLGRSAEKKYESLWEQFLRAILPSYRHRVALERWSHRFKGYRSVIPYRWEGLCSSLIDSVLAGDERLMSRCKGVERAKVIGSLHIETPDAYCGYFMGKKSGIDEASKIVIDEVVGALGFLRIVRVDAENDSGWRICMNIRADYDACEFSVCTDRQIVIGSSYMADVRVPYRDMYGRHLDVAGREVELSVFNGSLRVRALSTHGVVIRGNGSDSRIFKDDVAEVSEGSVILLGTRELARIVVSKVKTPNSST